MSKKVMKFHAHFISIQKTAPSYQKRLIKIDKKQVISKY